MSPSVLFNADLAVTELGRKRRATTTVAELMFGDPLDRALWRETTYQVPDSERTTCPVHQDWRSHCIDLHLRAA